MSGTFLSCRFDIADDAELRGTLIALLAQAGFTGFAEEPATLEAYIPSQRWTPESAEVLRGLLRRAELASVRMAAPLTVADRDWNEEWERSVQPIRVTERITVTPSWHRSRVTAEGTVIVIDPKMSFGTGYHETTRLMLRLMERHTPQGGSVLDVGTGTGILAIAAVLLGAGRALGVDTDEWSAVNGMENVRRNALVGSVEIRQGSIEVVPGGSFKMVLANIHKSVILEILDELVGRLTAEGILILSGLLREDEEAVGVALSRRSYRIVDSEREGEWIGLAARKDA